MTKPYVDQRVRVTFRGQVYVGTVVDPPYASHGNVYVRRDRSMDELTLTREDFESAEVAKRSGFTWAPDATDQDVWP